MPGTQKTKTKQKRLLFRRVYERLVPEIDPALTTDARTNITAAWKAVCSHKFCSENMELNATEIAIERATRAWLEIKRRELLGAPGAAAMAVDPQPRPPVMVMAVANNNITQPRGWHATPEELLAIQRNGSDIPNIVRNMNITALTASMQDMSSEMVSMVFSAMGLGESGPMCPVCMEPKNSWVRMARECFEDAGHRYCTDCATAWIKAFASEGGLACPMCPKAACGDPPRPRFPADPRCMFAPVIIKRDAGMVPFCSFQIPALQGALDARFGTDAPGRPRDRVYRCPECSTVSARGNDFVRVCPNPTCVAQFCTLCACVVDPGEPYGSHVNGLCMKVAGETAAIIENGNAKGFARCPKCGSRVWHSEHHGCHQVKCPTCTTKFCHSCDTPYVQHIEHLANCKCPLFCAKESFACKCSVTCPECENKKCEHCDGNCKSCRDRDGNKNKQKGTGDGGGK